MVRSYHETVLSGKLRYAVCQENNREGEGVSSWMTNALKPGNQLQRLFGRIIRTCMSPLWKTLHVQPLRNMGKCPKRYPSN